MAKAKEAGVYFDDGPPAMRCMITLQGKDFDSGKAKALQCEGAMTNRPSYGWGLSFCGDGTWLSYDVEQSLPSCPWSTTIRESQDTQSKGEISITIIVIVVLVILLALYMTFKA